MRPLLFYRSLSEYKKDISHHKFLEKLFGIAIDTYNVYEHENAYSHDEIPEYFPETNIKMPDSCWCDIPDQNRTWPQFYFNSESVDHWHDGPKFIAAGDDIFNINVDELYNKYGNNISGPGDWEIIK